MIEFGSNNLLQCDTFLSTDLSISCYKGGDFQQQFPMTDMDAKDILAGLQESIAPGSTIFIATNERDISFFGPIQEVYDVAFLGDFGTMLVDISEFC